MNSAITAASTASTAARPASCRNRSRRPGSASCAAAKGAATSDPDLALFEAIATTLGPSDALDRVLDIVGRRLELDTGWIWLRDPETGRFYLAASLNLPPLLRRPVMTAEPCWCMESFASGTLRSDNVDVVACSRLRSVEGVPDLSGGIRYHASVALRFAERRLGIMNLTGPAWRPLSERALQLLGTVGAIVGLAVERGSLADAAVAARGDERARLARELHDTFAQDLTAVGLHIEHAARHLEGEHRDARHALDTALAVTRRSVGNVRDSIGALRGDPLAGKALPGALSSLGHRFTSESGIRATVEATSAPMLAHRIEVELYLIASEALSNVRRHSGARRVRIRLSGNEHAAHLHVSDDGIGFETSAMLDDRYGLVGMHERAERLGGSLTISTPMGGGTALDVSVPLPS